MYDDRSRTIAQLLLSNFNVRIRRLLMFETNPRNTPFIPALYFGLNEDENTEKHYQIIDDSVESFTGRIKWCFGKSNPSRINYEIISCVARDIREKKLNEENQNEKNNMNYQKVSLICY